MDNLSFFLSVLPDYISGPIRCCDFEIRSRINEIRLRINKPVIIYIVNTPYFINYDGLLSQKAERNSVTINEKDFAIICDKLCNNSYHTNMHTLVDGYVTTSNGSRVGVSSTAVFKDGKIHSIRDITSLNIRISHDYNNCSRTIINKICNNGLPSIIVAGKVSCGKTTFLRDFARQLSNGYDGAYRKVAIIDERKEICSGFDVGINTDVLSGFEKSKGIEIATRTLSPDLIVCDEIGNENELNSIVNAFSSGVRFAVSIHLDEKFSNNIILSRLIATNQFSYLIYLKSYTIDYELIHLEESRSENYGNDNDNNFYYFNRFGNSR